MIWQTASTYKFMIMGKCKNIIGLLFFMCCISAQVFSQTAECGTDLLRNELMKDSAYSREARRYENKISLAISNENRDVNVIYTIPEKGEMIIFSIIGEKILEKNIDSETSVIDISNLSKGIYIVNYSNGNAQINKKIVNMEKIFKKFVLMVVLATTANSFAQSKPIDSLLQNISNKDIYIVLVKTMSSRIKGLPDNKIIEMGKQTAPQLIKILDDENKGIAAHVVLTKIWKIEEAVCCDILSNGTIEIVYINGLKIYIENDRLYSKPEDLKMNKAHWKKMIEA